MANVISKVEPNLLDINHPLYSALIDNPPRWWNNVKNDKELYIDIRKNNIIDIYYLGGRIAQLSYNARKKRIVTKAHPIYLGHTNKCDKRYYKERIKDGEKSFEAIYQECEKWLNKGRLPKLKKNIREYYSGEDEGCDTKEKYIQGNLIIRGREKYLDSEFQHRLYEGQRKSVRIDLVQVVANMVVFVELKRIKDNRLWKTNEVPEIITQMTEYREFLKENIEELTNYYHILYKIKKKLGLPLPSVEDVEKLGIDPEPKLLIKGYDNPNKCQAKREENILTALKNINITPEFIIE